MTGPDVPARRGRLFGTALAAATILSAALLAGCSTSERSSSGANVQFSAAKYGVPASPRLVAFGQPVPRGGGRDVTGKPYKVAGKWYYPKEDPDYEATGMASWYGANFHGRLTANGEIYDIAGLSGAHPTMPLPSYARVTNLANGRSVIVRVNDRGPYHGNRVIDVSSRAAEMLAFKSQGVARVHVEYVGRAPLDGQDDQMLLASYQGPDATGTGTTGTLLASAGPAPLPSAVPVPHPRPLVLAAIAPRPGPIRQALGLGYSAAPPADDPLGALLMRGSLSYADDTMVSPAQEAIGLLAAGEAAPAAPAMAAAYTVQVGAFGDPANAERMAALLAPYGTVVISKVEAGGRTLDAVRLDATGAVPAETVLAAAAAAGATGAFVLPR